jgi:alpha,alpha-trehalase
MSDRPQVEQTKQKAEVVAREPQFMKGNDGAQTAPLCGLRARDFEAAVFDLDGVVTRTARLHAAAWKQLFDEYLRQVEAASGEPFRPFDADSDYRRYVDGKPRYEGVSGFLESRGIRLPYGRPNVSLR